jgi:hypothetical protein
MDSWVWDKVGLELGEINIERPIESKGSSDRRNNWPLLVEDSYHASDLTLCYQSVQVLVVGSLDAEITSANIIDGFVVNHEAAVRMFQGCMSGQDAVVGLNNRSGILRCRVNDKFKFTLLAVVDRQTFHQQSAKAGPGATTE